MLRFRHKSLIILSGLIWLAIGIFLLQLGLHLILDSVPTADNRAFFRFFSGIFGQHETAAVAMIALALMVGFYKGRFVLSRSAQRVINRLKTYPEPTSLLNLYSLPFFLLIILMISLGMLMRFFGLSEEIRGFVDVAIGGALIQGAMFYFRAAFESKSISPTSSTPPSTHL